MNTGTYKKATVHFRHHDGVVELKDLLEASLTTDSTGMVKIIHFINGEKNPLNKRIICAPITSLVAFMAEGYAN